ncbi:Uma2 family endonuclease [Amycolatopsis sp. NBC_01286]|uniref:Uma2 family endonuclease n=1 Tax=Amycolatopsis sp. NBC_01286 TaxID=2903560 RepID=UPI002E15FDCD|nr:Uma2 family endonuclease [Amycolatopsis sp. NBC_01286]
MSGRLLSVEEYRALGETDRGFTELAEGRVVPSPGAGRRHNMAACRLAGQLERQLPRDLAFALGMDLDLQLAPHGEPGFSRRPDLLVFDRAAVARAGDLIRADEVAVVIEIVSPGSRRTDYRVKHDEYADAGIPHYWIVDIGEPVSLAACRGYQDAAAVTGTFATDVPFPVKLDLDALLS